MNWLIPALVLIEIPAAAQLRKQAREGAPVQLMTPAERAQLGDPLFNLVLKNKPNETRLDEIEKLIMGTAGTRHLFVLSEDAMDRTRGGARRSVSAYSGFNQNMQLDPNVTLSVFFNDQGFRANDLEAWGWDDARSRYNYYKLDKQPGESGVTWKFRGSSVDADKMSAAQRAGTCMRCHITGAPIMKELPIPWNNWHSFKSEIDYLKSSTTGHWPIAESARFGSLAEAQDFETSFILPSIRQFSGRRVDALLRPPVAGLREVSDGKRLLRPLFATTEYNITSAEQPSGLHPFPAVGSGPLVPVEVPDTFFLNANLLAGGGFAQYQGVGVPQARSFARFLRIAPDEYKSVVTGFGTKIGGRDFDTNFAWFVPEASHVDNQMVDILVRRGIITVEFAAAAQAVDLETPVFSAARESLLEFIPARFKFKPRGPDDVAPAHPDELTRTVIKSIRASGVPAGSPKETFVKLLEDPKPLDKVRDLVRAYLERQTASLQGGASRAAEIRRLYKIMLDRRRAAQARIPELVESNLLFPTGSAQ